MRQPVRRQRHHESVERAPPLIPGKKLRIAKVQAQPLSFDQHLGQCRNVAETDVHALSRDRMDTVRRIADKREPVRHDPGRMVKTKRIIGPMAQIGERAEESTHLLFQLGKIAALGQFHHPRRFIPPHGPDDRRTMPDRIIRKRQDGERPLCIENLISDILMAFGVMDRRDHRRMVILPARDRNPRRIPRGGCPPLRRDEKVGTYLFAGAERRNHAVRSAFDRDRARFHAQVRTRRGIRRRHKGNAQLPVFIHDAKRRIAIGRCKVELAGFQPVAHADTLDRAPMPGQPRADADCVQHALRRAGDRRTPPVELRGQNHFRVGNIDNDRRKAVRIQRHAQGRPDKPAAEDKNIRAIHGKQH